MIITNEPTDLQTWKTKEHIYYDTDSKPSQIKPADTTKICSTN